MMRRSARNKRRAAHGRSWPRLLLGACLVLLGLVFVCVCLALLLVGALDWQCVASARSSCRGQS